VESIALTASQHLDGKVNFTALSESIDDLVHQSKKLDEQKVDVLKRFRKVLPHPPKYQHKHGHGLGFVGRIARWWWSIRAKCGSDKGRERHESHLSMERDYGHKYEHDIHHGLEEVHPAQPQLQGELPGLPHLPHPGTPHPRVPIPPKKKKEIQELVKEIRGINKKLQYFEGGFISEEGIKVGQAVSSDVERRRVEFE
jgi:N-acetylated-alpha-linked acidic dipeptidase